MSTTKSTIFRVTGLPIDLEDEIISSFSRIRTDSPSAADVLSLMSVLNRQGIPESLLLEENSNRLSLEDSLAVLLGYSFIATETLTSYIT
jgi:hypothetical protein